MTLTWQFLQYQLNKIKFTRHNLITRDSDIAEDPVYSKKNTNNNQTNIVVHETSIPMQNSPEEYKHMTVMEMATRVFLQELQ